MSHDSSSSDPLSAAWDFGKLMPGFGFLEQWTKSAGAAMPSMGQWVAPTLDPAELEKRIQDLRTVQFWLEQNARMIGMTIQALEVQRMTLDTLKSMNVPVDALRESLKARTPPPAEPSPAASPAPTPEDTAAAAGAAIDPMRWWGSLTKQFTDLAANTMQDALKTERAATDAQRHAKPAGAARASAAKPSARNAAKSAAKSATKSTTASATTSATKKATKPAATTARRTGSTGGGTTSAED